MNNPWPFFLPTSAENQNDLQVSWRLLQPMRSFNMQPGFMLVIRNGKAGVIGDAAATQRTNLLPFAASLGDAPVIIMLANVPLGDMDWLHHPKQAAEHVRAGIDFANRLPLSGKKSITFHLNALCDENEFHSQSAAAWRQALSVVRSDLSALAQEAAKKGCALLVETVPVPEFGDLSAADKREYRQTRWRHLKNPWYLTSHWGIPELKASGLGIVLDLCHMRALLRSFQNDAEHAGLFPEDREFLQTHTLMKEVLALEKTDLVHLNDGRGTWTTAGGVFEEGVPLGEGDIQELSDIIRHLFQARTPTVLEVDEERDYIHRPGSRRSLAYLTNILSDARMPSTAR